MTELQPEYVTEAYSATDARLPVRAWKLAMRILQLERECAGRGRLQLDVIMLDGTWMLGVTKPAELERLGE